MKSIYLFFLMIIIPAFSFAQIEQNIQIRTEEAHFEKQQFIPVKNCFACIQGDVKRAFKFNYGNLFLPNENLADFTNDPSFISPSYMLEFEQKLTTAFSINTKLEWQNLIKKSPSVAGEIWVNDELRYEYVVDGFDNYVISFEPRWYMGKKQAIENGQSGDNLNGLYLGLNLSMNWWNSGKYVRPSGAGIINARSFAKKGTTQYAVLNLGWQQRFRDNGFVNFRLGTGFSKTTRNLNNIPFAFRDLIGWTWPSDEKWKTLLYYQVSWGAILEKRTNLPENSPKFWEYHEEEKDMWKIDLYNLFQGLNQKSGFGRANIAYERKILNSPFSLESGLQYHYRSDFELNNFSSQLVFQIEPRYYFLLNKHISQGKAANNLSSIYFGLLTEWHVGKTSLVRNGNNLFYDFAFGAQQRLFNHLFVDVRARLPMNEEAFYYDIRFGLAF